MNIEIARSFFLWCTVINYGLLLLWFLVFTLAHNWHFRLSSKWFRMSVEQYDLVNFGGIAIFKIVVILFNLVPYLAFCIIGR